MNLVFMGTPDFAVPALNALVEAGHDIVAVFTQPPRPAGRGKKERLSPVHVRANELGIDVHTPKSLRAPDVQAEIRALNADAAVVAAYGQILPKEVLNAPRLGCLNIHASLLPRWRGAAPIHRAIMAGDTATGVCIMQMDAGLDTGAVLTRARVPIAPTDTTGSLHDQMAQLGADMIVQALANLDDLAPTPQSSEGITYASRIDKLEARIDWTQQAAQIDAQIRGLSPFPGAWTMMNDTRIKLHLSRTIQGTGTPGQIIDAPLRVACGKGAVDILRLQREGRGVQDADEFLRGWSVGTDHLL